MVSLRQQKSENTVLTSTSWLTGQSHDGSLLLVSRLEMQEVFNEVISQHAPCSQINFRLKGVCTGDIFIIPPVLRFELELVVIRKPEVSLTSDLYRTDGWTGNCPGGLMTIFFHIPLVYCHSIIGCQSHSYWVDWAAADQRAARCDGQATGEETCRWSREAAIKS